ncbi:MAG: hypothetical protein V4496_06685, partial [Pseudomonadota bacterium]
YLGSKIVSFCKEKIGYQHNSQDVLVTLLDGLMHAAPGVKLDHQVTLPLDRLWRLLGRVKPRMDYGLTIGGNDNALGEDTTLLSIFARIQPNKVGPANSIMSFAELLALEFAALINGVFIKMPLASSVGMFLAIDAWLWTCVHNEGLVPSVIDWLSKAFTGEGAVSLIRITLASFLFWKVATLIIEAGIALQKRDAHFLEKLYGDPERLFLGFASFLGLGNALQFLPLLPDTLDLFSISVMNAIFSIYPEIVKHFINAAINMYPMMANVFIIEARVALKGQIPLNFLEIFFLGLKSAFLFGALVSGEHKPHLAVNEAALEKIIGELNCSKSERSLNRPTVAFYIVKFYDALGLPIKRAQAQFLFDELSVDQKYFETEKDLYNKYIFRGSNNLLQILFLLPGVFITYPYRTAMYGFAYLLNAPVIKHGIEKNFAEDLTMFIQVMAAASETFRTFLLGLNQLIKSSVALLNCLNRDFKSLNRNTLVKINMHNNILWIPRKLLTYCINEHYLNFSKSSYSALAHTANTHDVLEHEEPCKSLQSKSNPQSLSFMGTLFGANEKGASDSKKNSCCYIR